MNEGICGAQTKQLTDEEFSHRTAKKQKNEDREKYEPVEGSDSLSDSRLKASKQTQKDKVWMALGLIPPIPPIDRLCSQEAASSHEWRRRVGSSETCLLTPLYPAGSDSAHPSRVQGGNAALFDTLASCTAE